MKRHTLPVLGLVFMLAATASLADVKCVPIVAHGVQLDFSEDCGPGYDLCVFGWIKGTLNGEIETYVTEPFAMRFDQDRAEAQWGDELIVTNKGTIYARARAVFDVNGVNWAQVDTITGGTGAYEGATGEWINWGNNEGFQMRGEICTPKADFGETKANRGRVRKGGN